ncbi:hypothetical protein FOXYSP1_10763 [Fusarium oxysporum f. sp. phaseoli]
MAFFGQGVAQQSLRLTTKCGLSELPMASKETVPERYLLPTPYLDRSRILETHPPCLIAPYLAEINPHSVTIH